MGKLRASFESAYDERERYARLYTPAASARVPRQHPGFGCETGPGCFIRAWRRWGNRRCPCPCGQGL